MVLVLVVGFFFINLIYNIEIMFLPLQHYTTLHGYMCVCVCVCSWLSLCPLCLIRGAFIHDDQAKLKFQRHGEQKLPLSPPPLPRLCPSTLLLYCRQNHMNTHIHYSQIMYWSVLKCLCISVV